MSVETDIGSRLSRLREIKNELGELADKEKSLRAEKESIEYSLLQHCKNLGIDKISADGVSVKIEPSFRSSYTPELWNETLKWMVETGNGQLIQRRLVDARVEELYLAGQLPEGLTMTGYDKISVRISG